jgi:two-component system phosphate regulon sensor histidine kinase PhoR
MLLVLGIVSCLFYLLKIIKHQKQLAEVKNDLISNITHEFKTPIATIGVALESINNFNAIEDKVKTKKYINISSEQLSKLNIMVEKLLETATLDSDNLELNKETVDVVTLLNDLTQRYKIQFPKNEFNASLKVKNLKAQLDIFHFENAINNILDNAVKYGGKIISVDLIPQQNSFDILISDNGNTLSKANKDRIFEKFYRIPKGNTHDVKGFGIGLYYTKTIIEKHNGSIDLNLAKDLTTFKITLPNG